MKTDFAAKKKFEDERTFVLPGAPVKVTPQEFKRLAKLHAHAAAGNKPRRCWHEVLLREKGKTREYRCAVCKDLRRVTEVL